MTPAQQAALESVAGAPLTEAQLEAVEPLLAGRDDVGIAAALSEGRTKIVSTRIGIGDVLGALMPNGGDWLDAMTSLGAQNANVRWAVEMIKAGTLDAGHSATRALAQGLAAQVGTGSVADGIQALLDLAVVPDPVHYTAVSDALNLAEGRMTFATFGD